MKLYVAGRLKDCKIKDYIDQFQDNGYSITHNWTEYIGNEKSQSALDDINGVKNADVLVAIMNHSNYEYRGTFCEIGCAIGLSKLVIIVNDNPDNYCSQLCFYHHPSILHVSTVDEAIQLLEEYRDKTVNENRIIPKEQVNGNHYQKYQIQPIEVIEKLHLDFHQGNVFKYIVRYRDKNGIEDLEKAKWYIERMIDINK